MKDNATFTQTDFAKTVDHHFYAGQLRRLSIQFAALFSEMQVSVGKNDNPNRQTNLMTVPVKLASADRVVSSIKANNTQNTPLRLPVMAITLTNMELAYDRYKGLKQISRKVVFKEGSVLPDGGEVVYKTMPMPYYVDFNLDVITSNQNHMQQILEQIMMIFTPDIQIQTSDVHLDWSAITNVELMGLDIQETPEDAEQHTLQSTLQFRVVAYISAPANVKKNYIKKIRLRISELNVDEEYGQFYLDTDAPYETVADTLGMPSH